MENISRSNGGIVSFISLFLICFYRTMKANRLEFAERAARLNSPDYLWLSPGSKRSFHFIIYYLFSFRISSKNTSSSVQVLWCHFSNTTLREKNKNKLLLVLITAVFIKPSVSLLRCRRYLPGLFCLGFDHIFCNYPQIHVGHVWVFEWVAVFFI